MLILIILLVLLLGGGGGYYGHSRWGYGGGAGVASARFWSCYSSSTCLASSISPDAVTGHGAQQKRSWPGHRQSSDGRAK